MKNPEMLEALSALAIEKGIPEEIMLEALANARVTAYKRMPEAAEEALVEIDVETGEIRVIAEELNEEGNVTREVGRHARRLRPHRRARPLSPSLPCGPPATCLPPAPGLHKPPEPANATHVAPPARV